MRFLQWFMVVVLLATAFGGTNIAQVQASDTPEPQTVTIPGTIQSVLGCNADWQPNCSETYLQPEAGIWQATWEIPAGEYEYKVALNDGWDENYGANGQRGGANISLRLEAPTAVTFLYDHQTHVVADTVNNEVPIVIGDFQSELGCETDNLGTCYASWLQDANNDGLFTFVTSNIPAGTYEARVERNTVVYGADGTEDGDSLAFTVAADGDEIYFAYDGESNQLTISTEGAPKGNIGAAQAHWVAEEFIIWNVLGSPRYSYELHYSPEATLELGPDGISGGEMIALEYERRGPGQEISQRYPHLAGFSTLRIPEAALQRIPDIVRSQMAVVVRDDTGEVVDATSLQIPGVLDDLFFYTGELGISYSDETPSLRVWAPTAQNVNFLLFDDAAEATEPQTLPMDYDSATGVWSITGQADWTGKYYLYEVSVYVPSTSNVEVNRVTDPYALSLTTNSTRSQIINLDDQTLKPEGWDELEKPELSTFADISLYELHIRDFSIIDETVPEELRGTYMAFTVDDSAGMQHLRKLAEAGLTHLHLLPTFDIATIEEDRSQQQTIPRDVLQAFPGDAQQQQALLNPMRDQDGFNWGYDPYHYSVPEGSYSTEPSDTTRIVEFRSMVQNLNQNGLRVVMDVVYNHTNSSGQSERSVLDRIVPGYYHRLNATGGVEKSTCCDNTATEHKMMEKLMIDSVIIWATYYKVDGFRFDLMGHHMREDMINLRQALDELTLAEDGVDGAKIFVYGEGWDFGEVAENARGINATQLNLGGTGLATFNDRLRDAVRGGGPFSGFQEQGFATGLLDMPNAVEERTEAEQRDKLLEYMDHIRVGLAGNLAAYPLIDRTGAQTTGDKVLYNGQPTGYTQAPTEQIVYVSAHDNETLFDAIQAKAPVEATLAERVRMHNLATSIVGYSQGIPFFHAGDDLLRSKSLDRNSYNSGDWFNAIDWTGQTTNWGIGLPPAGDNEDKWEIIQPLLANPELRPTPEDIEQARTYFQEILQIRRSSPLFRLETAEQVTQRVQFLNTGAEQTPGLIVMQLNDIEPDLDPEHDRIVVVFNSTSTTQEYTIADLSELEFTLHPILAESSDEVVREASYTNGSFSVPAYTAAVFVQPESGEIVVAQPTVAATTTPEAPTQAAATEPAAPTPVEPTVAPTTAAPTPETEEPAAESGSSIVIWGGAAAALIFSGIAIFLIRQRRRKG